MDSISVDIGLIFFQVPISGRTIQLFNILILGGTRFLGLALCESLVSSGNKVSISSRRRLPIELPITQYTCERLVVKRNKFNLNEFDYVIDFTAYRPEDLEMLPSGVPSRAYILISTDWVSRLNTLDPEPWTQLSEPNLKYTLEKSNTEIGALAKFSSKTMILRLPVALGLNDHHNRLGFYWARAQTNKHQLLVEDDFNVSYILVPDFVLTLKQILSSNQSYSQCLTVRSKTESYNNLVRNFNLAYKRHKSSIQYTVLQKAEIGKLFPIFAAVDPLLRQELRSESDSGSLIFESNCELIDLIRTKISVLDLTKLQIQALDEERRGLYERR